MSRQGCCIPDRLSHRDKQIGIVSGLSLESEVIFLQLQFPSRGSVLLFNNQSRALFSIALRLSYSGGALQQLAP